MKANPEFPKWVAIEPTSHCNYKCIMCPNKLISIGKKGFMDFDLFKKIINECKDWKITPEKVPLTGRGESLLHPKFLDMLSYVKESGLRLTFSTNGSLINERFIDKIISIGVEGFVVSMNADSQESYNKISGRDNFDKVKKNVLNLINKRNQLGLDYPKISIRFTELPEIQSERNQLYKEWEGIANKVYSMMCGSWGGTIVLKNKKFVRLPCNYIRREMRIMWNGNVLPCCWDWDDTIVLGNVKDNTLYDIWNGHKFNQFRKDYQNTDMCKKCGFYKL